METKKYKISGMSCQHCVMAINKEFQKLQIEDKKTEIGSAEITFDEQKLTEKEGLEFGVYIDKWAKRLLRDVH